MKFFDTVEMAPPDPILGLNAAFKADPRSNKVKPEHRCLQDR